jgi:hypothetical protein
MRTAIGVLALPLLVAGLCRAQDLLPIEAEPMSPAYHPIAPADGAVAVTDPPPMVFWYTMQARSWTVEISRNADFTDPIVVPDLELPMHNHTAVLGEGTWHWRYFYRNEAGDRSEYSPVRSFTVTAESIPFPVPSVEQILAELPGHPRMFTTRAGLDEFRARADGPAKAAAAALIRSAEGALEREVPEPELGSAIPEDATRRGLTFWLRDGVALQALNLSPGSLENHSKGTRNLAMAYLLTGDERYAQAAKRWLLWQANFRNDWHQEEKAHHDTVHCYEYGLQRAASVYDSICEVLSDDERAAVLAHIQYHGDAVYRKLRFHKRTHLRWLDSHAQQDMHELVTTALAVANDLPDAREWLEYLIPQYVNRLAWGYNDGGYCEGHYYNYKWHGMLRCALALRTATGIDLLRKPRFTNAGRFWLYCMSLNYWWPHFGDNFGLISGFAGSSNDRDGASFLAGHYGDRYVQWWAGQIDADLQFPLRYFGDETLAEKPPVDIPQAAMYPETGWAALYDRFYDHSSTRLFFECSPWGSCSHSHQDQNSFVIHAFGQILAIDKGYYGYYGDEYHRQICQASRSHNTILVDGEGQGHGIQYNGRIVDFHDTRDFSFVMGDATAAYGERLSTFLRAVVFIRPDIFVIYDEIQAPEPHRYTWLLNAFHQMGLDEQSQIITINEPGAKLEVNHLLPGGLTYRQDNVRPYELKARYMESFPEQWTAWCETSEPAADTRFLTVLVPYRAGDGVRLVDAQPIETAHLVGARLTLRGGEDTVLFQRDIKARARGTWQAVTTDAICTVMRAPAEGAASWVHVTGTVLEADGQTLTRSEQPVSSESATPVEHRTDDLPPVALEVHDSHGSYRQPLEATADRWGRCFYFARLRPREQGRYQLRLDPERVEVLVQDRYDAAHSSAGHEVELRDDCEVILRCNKPLAGTVPATLTESCSGRLINLVRNGGFEAGTPDYPPFGWWVRHYSTGDPSFVYWCDDDPAEGDHCMRVFRHSNRIRSYSQGFDVDRPGTYVLRFKAKATCAGAIVNTSWSPWSLSARVEPSDEWRQYEVVREDIEPHRATIHVLFDTAEGPEQTLWVDDLQFGYLAK